MPSLRRRLEQLEKTQSPSATNKQFDEDALAIYCGLRYLDATMDPTYDDVEPSAVYLRGKVLRDRLYGPIIPVYLDQHIERYTRASGEFELAFGREA